MSKSSTRQIPKALADFGEKQFEETGPDSVEVLRVKASTIRKYWSRLQGIAYLVAVISSDRVRVYFFNANAVMLVGENIDHDQYIKVRGKSKLIRKYERPKPPTELELRMEATEEVRSALAKALKRVSRFLGEKEPDFPNIYVSKSLEFGSPQAFGLKIDDDGSFLFLESHTTPSNLDVLTLRSAFLTLLDRQRARLELSQCVANGITAMLLKDKPRQDWIKRWLDATKDTEFQGIVLHLVKHLESYGSNGISRILHLIRKAPLSSQIEKWEDALYVIHRYHEVNLGTEAWPLVDGFCRSLEKSRSLVKNRYTLDAIHLSPRVICNVVPLGLNLFANIHERSQGLDEPWLSIGFLEGSRQASFVLDTKSGTFVESISYHLRLDDVFAKHGGILSTGKDILRWALSKLSVFDHDPATFEIKLPMKDAVLTEAEKAVLERLSLGDPDILSNTLVGSPQRIESLVNSGCIAIIPSFAHIGVEPNYLVRGNIDTINKLILPCVLEATVIETEQDAYAVVSAPSVWGRQLTSSSCDSDLNLYVLNSIESPRAIVREEKIFSK
ncbi:MAG: hypothetical protein ACFFED_08530 [Candidatus Thorarchaeota archaeon]